MAEPLSLTARFVAAPAVIPPVPTLAGVIAPLAPASPRLISGGALWRGVGRFSGSERATGCRRRCWPRTCLGATSRSLALREAALLSRYCWESPQLCLTTTRLFSLLIIKRARSSIFLAMWSYVALTEWAISRKRSRS